MGLDLTPFNTGCISMKINTIKLRRILFHLIAIVFLANIFVACDSNGKKNALDLTDRITNEALEKSNIENKSNKITENKLIFGFDLRNSPSEDAKQYLPFLNYLSEATGFKFELKFTAKGNDIATELGEGRIHLAAIGATSFIKAHEHFGAIALTRGINNNDKAEYRSIIVVSPTSKLQNLESLKGKRFAFGSIDSTQGHLLPRIELGNRNIYLQDLGNYQYTGSHLNCANAVISGQMDACGMQDTLASEFASKGLLRVLFTSDYYPSSGIVANQHLSQAVLNKITQALLDFKPEGKHGALLYNWDKTEMPKGFIRANLKDYVDLRKWMINFKMLTVAGRVN